MRKLPSIAAFLESAEWKSRIGADIIVDKYRAALEFGSDVFTARNIARDHAAAQSEEIFRKTRFLKARDGDRAKKLFQFLDEIGARAPRAQPRRVLEMAESSLDNENKIAELSGGQKELELVVPTPSGVPSPETKAAARSEPIEVEPAPLKKEPAN